jgi:hypothetical protein
MAVVPLLWRVLPLVGLVLAGATVAVRAGHDDVRPAMPEAAAVLPASPDPGGGPGGGPGPGGRASLPARGEPTASPAVGARPAAVRYRFDSGVRGQVLDGAGALPLKPAVAAGGALATEPRDGGAAVRFPPPCATYGDPACPRAILESGPAEVLNPGARALRFGASIRLSGAETSPGANVLQKGYAQGRSQYKLQVDGLAGRPSCVLVGAGTTAIRAVTSTVAVADGRWHRLECARAGAALTILVDGSVTGRLAIPAELSVANSDPLRIGGKGTSPNNDQFHGAVDDVFVVIG